MNSSPQSTISTFSTCAHAYQTFTAIRASVLKLAVFAIFLPLALSELVLSQIAKPAVAHLKELTEQLLSKSTSNYQVLLEASADFFSPCLFIMSVLMLIFFSAYMGIIKLAVAYKNNESLPSAPSAFFWGMRQFFPKGLFLLMIFLALSLERFLWGPFRIFSMLILMAPVLYTAEGAKMGSAIRRALFLKYINPAVSTGFNIAFTLIVFGALIFFGETLIALMNRTLLTLDQWLGLARDIWTMGFFNFPFSVPFFVVNLLGSFAYALLLASFPLFTVALYFRTSPKTFSTHE